MKNKNNPSGSVKRGRPDDVRQALLLAAVELNCAARSPTLREIIRQARVGQSSGLNAIKNMRRAGLLVICGERHVAYRNKPVAEYAPACPWVAAVNSLMAVDFSGLQCAGADWLGGVCG